MAKPGETLLVLGVIGGVAYLFRDKLKTLFTPAKAGQSTAGTHAPGVPTSNPTGAAALDALSKVAQGIFQPFQWGVAQPTFSPGITYQGITVQGTTPGGSTIDIFEPPTTDTPENQFPGRD